MNSMIAIAGIAGTIAFCLGLIIGHFAINQTHEENKKGKNRKLEFNFQDHISKEFISETNTKNIENTLRFLSSKPHLVGSERDLELANYIKNLWMQQGLDSAELVPYDLLLSFPSKDNENKVQIIEPDGTPVFTSLAKEMPNGEPTETGQAYLGHTPAGDVSGELVFVNYGRPDDFAYLESIGIDVKGKICIAKYGKCHRGNKIENAAARGSVGVILYLDPADVARNGTDPGNVYPDTWWLPGDGIQRGSALTEDGDPLTRGYPALERVYRHPKEDSNLPKIPAQPISYNDAERLLSILGGNESPKAWKGGLNITYRIGPGFNMENSERKCRIATYNREEITTANNVIGWIKGSEEPDRYVLLGNHRDAWGYGAVDPSSGTAVLLEVTRIFGKLLKEGWRPKRSLVFCSWVAEEQGIMGSTEWVEENFQKLFSRAVVYLNVDIAVMGSVFDSEGSPMLTEAIIRAANIVPHPEVKGKTLYDGWAQHLKDLDGSESPRITLPGSGTDHAAFYFYAGVPSATVYYGVDQRKFQSTIYPAYHTAYDTFDYMVKFIDPKFVFHQAIGRLLGILAHYFTDSVTIPYNISEYSEVVMGGVNRLKGPELKANLREHIASLSSLEESLTSFATASSKLNQNIKTANPNNLLEIRKINDQLLMVERFFIKLRGLPGRPFIRHMIFSPSQFDSYSRGQFPVLYDSLYGIDQLSTKDKQKRRQTIEEYLSDLTTAFQSAASFMDPDFLIQKR